MGAVAVGFAVAAGAAVLCLCRACDFVDVVLVATGVEATVLGADVAAIAGAGVLGATGAVVGAVVGTGVVGFETWCELVKRPAPLDACWAILVAGTLCDLPAWLLETVGVWNAGVFTGAGAATGATTANDATALPPVGLPALTT